MNRLAWFLVCLIVGLGTLAAGLLIPIHLRAVDDRVIARAGKNFPGLVERGTTLAMESNIGAAQMLLLTARYEKIPDSGKLASVIANVARQNPALQTLGSNPSGALKLLQLENAETNRGFEPFTEIAIRQENRENILAALSQSSNPLTRELLRFRDVTNTVLFPPSQSASGQALDAAISICGLLVEQHALTSGLSDSIFTLAREANSGGNSESFEEVLMNFMSLGQRLNWGQLTAFVGTIPDSKTLRVQTEFARKSGAQLPILFSAVELSGEPSAVAKYLTTFSQSGLKDLSLSLRSGEGGVKELLKRNQRLATGGFRVVWLVDWCLRAPLFALIVKWFLYLAGGFLLAAALHFARPMVSELERPLEVRGFHFAREFLFALGFLLVVLLLSEPFLSQESQRMAMPIRLHLPTSGGAVAAGNLGAKSSLMNQSNLLTMLLFFVLQGLLYIACVVKLAEIRRQRVFPRIKLRLLENEEHLFDAGLYLGFLGTIISFVLFSVSHAQFSLMVAYSSTSFGIIFVSFFKIFHLRPARRKILLQAEADTAESVNSPAAHPVTAL
jgi:hypothetical protein